MTRWQREMERMFDDFFGRRWEPFRIARWLPAGVGVSPPSVELDVYEEKDEIVAKAEVPGLEKDDIEVSIADSTLTIKGEKKKEEEVKDEDYYRLERSYGSFVRSVELPRAVQADKVKATFKSGVLEIRMPKSEEAKKKEIKVKVD